MVVNNNFELSVLNFNEEGTRATNEKYHVIRSS